MRFRTLVGVALLLGSAAPMLTLAAVELDNSQQLVEDLATDRLQGLGTSQTARVQAYVDANQERLSLMTSRTQLRESLAAYLEDGDEGERQRVETILQDIVEATPVLLEVRVHASNGTVVAATDPLATGTPGRPVSFLAGLTGPRVDLFHTDHGPRLDLAGPLEKDGRALGVMVATVRPTGLNDIAQDYSGLGDTGETVVATGLPDGSVLFLTPLRFDPDADLARRVPPDQRDVPAVLGLAGRRGLVEGRDYRQEPVLAAVQEVTGAPWIVVVKQDVHEVLAPVRELRAIVLAVTAVVGAVAIVLAITLAHTIGGPVRHIHRIARHIHAGRPAPHGRSLGITEFEDVAEALQDMSKEVQRVQAGLERTVADRTAQLEAANEQLSRFASGISHDIREPLMVMQLTARRLRRAIPEAEPDVQRRLDDLEQAIRSASGMVEGMLEWTRSAAQAERPGLRGSVDLEVCLEAALRDLQARIDARKASIQTDLLPTVQGSHGQLKLVLQNLIGNAVKYGGEPPRIQVRAVPVGPLCRIEVQDNGPGIPDEDKQRIFSPFQQIEGRSREGVGLGLSMCRRVVESLGGQIGVDDVEGGGSLFWFTLPAQDEPGPVA